MNLLLNSKNCLVCKLLVLEHCESISFHLKMRRRGDTHRKPTLPMFSREFQDTWRRWRAIRMRSSHSTQP
jgi:hypothetical protein